MSRITRLQEFKEEKYSEEITHERTLSKERCVRLKSLQNERALRKMKKSLSPLPPEDIQTAETLSSIFDQKRRMFGQVNQFNRGFSQINNLVSQNSVNSTENLTPNRVLFVPNERDCGNVQNQAKVFNFEFQRKKPSTGNLGFVKEFEISSLQESTRLLDEVRETAQELGGRKSITNKEVTSQASKEKPFANLASPPRKTQAINLGNLKNVEKIKTFENWFL
jgi:hypothetical protein